MTNEITVYSNRSLFGKREHLETKSSQGQEVRWRSVKARMASSSKWSEPSCKINLPLCLGFRRKGGTSCEVWTVYEMAIWAGAWHPLPFPGCRGFQSCMAGNRTRILRMCMTRGILRSLSAYRMYKPPILRLSSRHVHGDPDGFVLVRLERSTGSVMDSDDSLSYTVHNVT